MSVVHRAEFGLIEKVASSGKGVNIEGWANKAIVDRGGDIIPKSAWRLENYQKNPIVLFNHDKSKPIGKVTAVEARDEGLFVKARISGSADPEIAKIRDLITEGVLNAFSVGFDMIDSEASSDKGVTEIKAAELFELSVVALPMNQESLFSVAKFYDYDKVAGYFKATNGGLTTKAADAPKDDEDAPKVEGSEDGDTGDASNQEGSKEAEGDKMELEVQSLSFPKAEFKDEAAVQEWAVANGWEAEAITDDGDNWTLALKPVEEFSSIVDLPLDNGVVAKVGVCKPAPEPMDEDEAPAEADGDKTKAQDEPKAGDQPTEPLPSQPPEGDGNESLLLARQTNVLLGQVVAELQALKQSIADLSVSKKPEAAPGEADAPKSAEAESSDDELDSESLAKSTELVTQYLATVRKIYERIGA